LEEVMMRTKAAVLNAIGSAMPYADSRPITIEELDFDPPREGEVVVRITSAGLCHSDLSNLNGTIPKPTPLALGHEAAGVVEEIGRGVTQVKPGDHVVFAFVPSCGNCEMCIAGKPAMCIPGLQANFANALLRGGTRFRLRGEPVYHHLGVSGFAERTVCAQESLVPIPDDVPLEFAAVFGCGALTGLGAVFNVARVEPGMTVAVFGAGGVGLMAVLAAICCGATVIVVDPLAHKRALASDLGAKLTIDPAAGDPATQINERLGIRGVDYAIEATGIPSVVMQALLSTGPGGTAIALGVSNPKSTAPLAPFDLLRAERTLRGSFMGAAVPRRDIPRYINLWRDGKLPVEKLLSGTIALGDLNAAFDRLAAGDVVRQMCLL
jgi:alcohol dehydrogenase